MLGAISLTLAIVCNAQAAVEVLYTFDNVGDTSSVVKDNNAVGGLQDATTGNGPTLAAGLTGSGMYFSPGAAAYIATNSAISYNALTFSSVINLETRVGAANYILFATRNPNAGGWVQFDVRTDGGLEFYGDGGVHYYASAANVLQFGMWQGVGVTVAGGIATFLRQRRRPGAQRRDLQRPTDGRRNWRGGFRNVLRVGGWSLRRRYRADALLRHCRQHRPWPTARLSASEMAAVQAIPEPTRWG
jgi:hypothetical protein